MRGGRLDYADYKVVRPKNCESETREKDLRVIWEMFFEIYKQVFFARHLFRKNLNFFSRSKTYEFTSLESFGNANINSLMILGIYFIPIGFNFGSIVYIYFILYSHNSRHS